MATEIALSDKQRSEIQRDLYDLIYDSIEKAKNNTDINRKVWMRKSDVIKYLPMSPNSFDTKFNELPSHELDGMILYSKKEIDEFILNH